MPVKPGARKGAIVIITEIPPMYVIDITIAIVIDTIIWDLILINPDALRELWNTVVYSRVY